jgi:hypothetical protein
MPIGRCPVFLLAVALSSGGNATSITVKGSKWGDYFIYDDTIKNWRSFSNRIIIGDHSSTDNTTALGIGMRAGYLSQSATAIAIGLNAGNANQNNSSVAVGTSAGENKQRIGAVGIGYNAGQTNQGTNSIAIGYNAGQINQPTGAVAIGANAGQYSQATGAVAIGYNAGQYSQATGAVAIGYNAGQTNQGTNSIAIGYNSNAGFQSIVIDASYSTPINAGATGVFIRPVRGPMEGSNLLSWDTTTKEIFYNGSSQRYKYDIQDLPVSKLSINDLQPREFKYNLDNSPDNGLIAEEAYKCDNAFAYLDNTQIPEGIQWNAITVALVKELQQMKKRIQILRTNQLNQ